MRRTWRDVIMVVFAVQFAAIGLWAVTAPRSFYDSFPGAGRAWVAVDGPFNEHLVRDVGGLLTAIAAVNLLALITRSPAAVRAAGLVVAVFSLPHTIYHVTTIDLLPVADGVGNVASLTLGLVVAIALVISPTASPGHGRSEPGPAGRRQQQPVT